MAKRALPPTVSSRQFSIKLVFRSGVNNFRRRVSRSESQLRCLRVRRLMVSVYEEGCWYPLAELFKLV